MLIMQRAWIVTSLKNMMLPSVQRVLPTHGVLNTARLLPAASTIQVLNPKSIHVTFVHCNNNVLPTTSVQSAQLGYIHRILKKIGVLNIQKYKYMALACLMYEHMLNQVDYDFFYKHFNMPDTLFSWFLVTELHVWMLMVRYMAEGKDGQFIRNNIVTAMWDDTKARTEQLGKITSKIKHKQIEELSHQFNAAIIGYDEGILSDDKVLAGALWRRFFCLECNNPEYVELLINYIRIQISLLDGISSEEIFRTPTFKLIDLKSLCKHQ